MIQDHYPLFANETREIFTFESIGPKGRIAKIIVFDLLQGNVWNLGFGDQLADDWDDAAISNNGDIVRVISTVAQAALDFSERWPERRILINPVDEKRKRFYNTIFKRRYHEITQVFEVKGWIKQGIYLYAPERSFDLFLLTRKNH